MSILLYVSTNMDIERLNKWIHRNGMKAVEVAAYLGCTNCAISKWRERGYIPTKLDHEIEALMKLDRQSVLRKLSRQTPELF